MDRVTELRIKDNYGTFSEVYPIGAKGENVYLNNGASVETLLDIFQVLNNVDEAGQMLYSAFNTAYRKYEDEIITDLDGILRVKDDETLYLISKYFDIEDNDTNHQTLIVNIKDSY